MTLKNFEKQAKERLNNREIQPTNRAWNEISAALEKKDNTLKPGYFWYGIAAGFIGVLIISVIYFKPATAVVKDNQIVTNPGDEIKVEQKEAVKGQELLIPKEPIQSEAAVIAGQSEEFKKKEFPKQQKMPAIAFKTPAVEKNINLKVKPSPSEEIIDAKLEEVLTKVSLLEHDKYTLSDAEVDSLLWQAQKEILKDRLFQEDNPVNATVLLTEVEDELDQSFRDQIFEKLKTGFNKVRTAVADRNN